MGRDANEKIDQFAFAVVLWELFSRKGLLFLRTKTMPDGRRVEMTADLWSEIVLKGGRASIPATWPERARAVISQCWHSQPGKRPAFTAVIVALAPLQKPQSCTDPRECKTPKHISAREKGGVGEAGCACTVQ